MKDKVSVSLSNIFDVWLRNYKNHLKLTQLEEKLISRKEESREKDKLFSKILNELEDSYEKSLRQSVKEILFKQDIIIPKISNIREILGEVFRYEFYSHTYEGDNPIHMKLFSHTEWFVKNLDKINELSSIRKSSSPVEDNGMFQHNVFKNTINHLHKKMWNRDYWFPKK